LWRAPTPHDHDVLDGELLDLAGAVLDLHPDVVRVLVIHV
jgi:hypothetical protein